MSWIILAANLRNTDMSLLTGAKLGPYSKSAGVYHCPSDASHAPGQGLRVRSFSMNCYVGPPPVGDNQNAPPNLQQFVKMPDFRDASKIFVFLDEHPDSINDGYFIVRATTDWVDLPASYHDGAGCFSFADGHSEIHKWRDASTRKPIQKASRAGLPLIPRPGEFHDLDWVFQRMTFATQ